MKKRIISIALLVISFVFALLLASCGKGNERTEVVFIEKPDRYESCEHNWQIKSQALNEEILKKFCREVQSKKGYSKAAGEQGRSSAEEQL